MVDAIESAVGSIGAALAAAASFTADQMANLAKAVLAAGRSIAQLVSGALEAAVSNAFALCQERDQGHRRRRPRHVRGPRLDRRLRGGPADDVSGPIDSLGHTLGELLSWMAARSSNVVRKFTAALIAIGKTVGNLIDQAVRRGSASSGRHASLDRNRPAIGPSSRQVVTRPHGVLKAAGSGPASSWAGRGELIDADSATGRRNPENGGERHLEIG